MKNKLLLALLLVSSVVSAKSTHKYEEASSSGVILYQDAPRLLMLDNTSVSTRWTNDSVGRILVCTDWSEVTTWTSKCGTWVYLESKLPTNASIYSYEIQSFSSTTRLIVRYSIRD